MVAYFLMGLILIACNVEEQISVSKAITNLAACSDVKLQDYSAAFDVCYDSTYSR